MFGRKKSANKANKNSNVEAQREATSSKTTKSCSSSKQQSKTSCCGKKSGSTKACK